MEDAWLEFSFVSTSLSKLAVVYVNFLHFGLHYSSFDRMYVFHFINAYLLYFTVVPPVARLMYVYVFRFFTVVPVRMSFFVTYLYVCLLTFLITFQLLLSCSFIPKISRISSVHISSTFTN